MKKLFILLFIVCEFSGLIGADITWTDPHVLSTVDVSGSNPQITIDLSGNVVAVWIENGSLLSSVQPAGGSWKSLANLSSSGAVSSPRIGVDSEGNVTAIWIDGGVVTTSYLAQGASSWGQKTALSATGATNPQLVVDASGNAVAVWVINSLIASSTRPAHGSWGFTNALSSANSDNPQVAIGASGDVMAVWHTLVNGNQDVVMSATSSVNGIWNPAQPILNTTIATHHNYPQVTVDPFGNATAIWYSYDISEGIYTDVQLLSATFFADNSNWSVPTPLSDLGLRSPANLSASIISDKNGNIIAIWTNSPDGQSFHIESSVKPNGGAWAPFSLPGISSIYSFAVDVAINSQSDALAICMGYDGMATIVQAQETSIAGPYYSIWTTPITVSQGGENAYPQVAFALNGETAEAAAIWISYDGSCNTIQAATGSKTVVSPPSDLSVMQQSSYFGAFTDYYNTITWQASPSQNILQYNIYRNGVFITVVDPTVFTFIDHNAKANGAVTYGVSASDSQRSQSAIINISYP